MGLVYARFLHLHIAHSKVVSTSTTVLRRRVCVQRSRACCLLGMLGVLFSVRHGVQAHQLLSLPAAPRSLLTCPTPQASKLWVCSCEMGGWLALLKQACEPGTLEVVVQYLILLLLLVTPSCRSCRSSAPGEAQMSRVMVQFSGRAVLVLTRTY